MREREGEIERVGKGGGGGGAFKLLYHSFLKLEIWTQLIK
jgi:hypothetical protein